MKKCEKQEYGSKKDILLVNFVTTLRFIASFAVVPVFKVLGGISAAVFSGIFLFTDCIDGFLARKLKASTFFGALFDGLTDKAFGIISFALLMTVNPILFSIPLILEVCIALVQNKKLKNGANIKSNMIGKIKTWVLSMSIVGSFVLVDTLDIPLCLDYIKNASLANIGNIKNHLALLGVELPTIIFQLLTLASYNKEVDDDIKEYEKEQANKENLEQTQENNATHIEYLKPEEPVINLDDITRDLEDIQKQRESLQSINEILAKLKTMTEKMFDPEFYQENKDMPMRKLAKDLFNE